MLLLSECSSLFSDAVKRRGKNYFLEDRVELLECAPGQVRARVEGSDLYLVEFEWDEDDGHLAMYCGCPHFGDGSPCKHLWAMLLEVSRRGLVGADVDPVVQEPAGTPIDWKSLARNALVRQGRRRPENNGRLAGRKAHFVLLAGESVLEQRLVLGVYQQEGSVNGQIPPLLPVDVVHRSAPVFLDPADHMAIDLLKRLCGQDENALPARWSRHVDPRVRLENLFQVVLPTLAETGRLSWALDVSQVDSDRQPVAWDSDPWQLRISIAESDERRAWNVSGQLVNPRQTIACSDAVFVLESGLVLHDGRVAPLKVDRGLEGWIEPLHQHPVIEIPYADRHKVLPVLRELLPSETDLPSSLQADAPATKPQPILRLIPQEAGRSFAAGAYFDYCGTPVPAYSNGNFIVMNDALYRRDWEEERRRLAELPHDLLASVYIPRPEHCWTVLDAAMLEVTSAALEAGWTVEASGKRVRRPGGMSLSVKSDIDWFELDGQCEFDGTIVGLPDLLQAIRYGERFVRLSDGSQGILPEQWLAQFQDLVELGTIEEDSIRFRSSQGMLLDALLAAQDHDVSIRADRDFRKWRKKLRSFSGIKPRKVARGFRGTLRPYQQDGLNWLHFLREYGFGGCLADDMGLGKTVQILALLQSRRLASRSKSRDSRTLSLIVVPKSLVFNWIEEAERFTPNLRIAAYIGPERPELLERDDLDVLVTTYGTLRRDAAQLKDVNFDYVVLDEAQAIKNDRAQVSKAARLLKANHRLALTGTPVENHLGELWSIFEFLNPGMLGNTTAFQRAMKNADQSPDGTIELLRKALAPFLLRRTKQQVLTELPDKTEQILYCDMSQKQRRAYDDLRDYYRAQLTERIRTAGIAKSKIHVLEALLRLRQAACHPGLLDSNRAEEPSAKLNSLLEQIEEVVSEGHKALVFSQFTSFLSIVRDRFDRHEIEYEYLDGSTRDRQQAVRRFQEDPQCKLFLISLKAGGHGLNLTAADYVYLLDPWWNPAVESQAIDRAHRMGQQRPVFAYRLICRDTVEERIAEMQEKKRDLAEAIVNSNSNLLRKLTAEDLQRLLS